MNRYQCTGRLVEDPVLRHTTSGKDVCEMRLAVDGMAPGNETGFLNVAQFGAGGVAAADTLTKGWLVAFDGRLEHHTWKDRESGQNRHAYVAVGNVEFLTAPRSHGERTPERAAETAVAVESDRRPRLRRGRSRHRRRPDPWSGPLLVARSLTRSSSSRVTGRLEIFLQLLAGSDPGERLLEVRYRPLDGGAGM